jgi:seryl-tRNA(Sec) selenium transferase
MSSSTAYTDARPDDRDIRQELGLRPIINVSGTMTALGASIIVPEAIAAMAAIAPEFVEIDQLQRVASRRGRFRHGELCKRYRGRRSRRHDSQQSSGHRTPS